MKLRMARKEMAVTPMRAGAAAGSMKKESQPHATRQ